MYVKNVFTVVLQTLRASLLRSSRSLRGFVDFRAQPRDMGGDRFLCSRTISRFSSELHCHVQAKATRREEQAHSSSCPMLPFHFGPGSTGYPHGLELDSLGLLLYRCAGQG